jgi:hypothetical protein
MQKVTNKGLGDHTTRSSMFRNLHLLFLGRLNQKHDTGGTFNKHSENAK